MFLEIALEHLNVCIKGLLLFLELPDTFVFLRPESLLALAADQEKGFAILSPMFLNVFLIVEQLGSIANFGETAGFSSADLLVIFLSAVLFTLNFTICFARCPIINGGLATLAFLWMVDNAFVFAFARSASRMVGSWNDVLFPFKCATDVIGFFFSS